MKAISAENLSFSYGSTPILTNVSFSIDEGEFVGLIGPNGGGKTTLLKLLMGFLSPSKGKVAIFGSTPKQGRKQIGWVPQNFHFDPHFPISVLDVVLGGRLSGTPWHGRFSKEDRRTCLETLAKVGMERYAKEAFSALSGGQAQRVLLARALAGNPALLLLDEPTASVDLSAQAEIYQILGALREKMTIVMVTHDLSAAMAHVGRVFLVQRSLAALTKDQVCEHFAIGLYHPPLKGGS